MNKTNITNSANNFFFEKIEKQKNKSNIIFSFSPFRKYRKKKKKFEKCNEKNVYNEIKSDDDHKIQLNFIKEKNIDISFSSNFSRQSNIEKKKDSSFSFDNLKKLKSSSISQKSIKNISIKDIRNKSENNLTKKFKNFFSNFLENDVKQECYLADNSERQKILLQKSKIPKFKEDDLIHNEIIFSEKEESKTQENLKINLDLNKSDIESENFSNYGNFL